MPGRNEVYEALDAERVYQVKRWGENRHSITEFLVYMQDYAAEGLHNAARLPDAEADEKALEIVRKIGALAVSCMEQHGAPKRP